MEEQINIDQLTYRFLEKSEQSLYIDFYDQFNNILGVSKDQLLYHRAKEESSFLNDDRKTVGAFTSGGRLLTTISGHFSDKTKEVSLTVEPWIKQISVFFQKIFLQILDIF